MSLLRLIPAWLYAGVVLLAIIGWQCLQLADAETTLARLETRLATERQARAEERAQAIGEAAAVADLYRRREAGWSTAQQKVAHDTQPALDASRAAAGRLADLAGRLRDAEAAIAGHRGAAADSTAADGGQAADEAARMHAELQASARAAEEVRAGFADEAHAASERCAADYDALSQ